MILGVYSVEICTTSYGKKRVLMKINIEHNW